jgi:hypothetical protein
MSHHIGLQILRAKVRGFQVTGSTLQSRISKAKGARKSRLWELKHRLGNQARYHLVAYGLLRGVPYERIERCSTNNKLNAEKLLEIMVAHTGIVEMTCPDGRKLMGWAHYDLERVKALLDVRTPMTAAAVPVPASEPSSKPTGLLQRAHVLLRKMA